jgi:toxin YoeB
VVASRCFEDLEHWTETDPRVAQKIYKLIKECRRTPFHGLGKPEPLQGELKGLWSRRITGEHRLIYRVSDGRIDFIQARYHYDE